MTIGLIERTKKCSQQNSSFYLHTHCANATSSLSQFIDINVDRAFGDDSNPKFRRLTGDVQNVTFIYFHKGKIRVSLFI